MQADGLLGRGHKQMLSRAIHPMGGVATEPTSICTILLNISPGAVAEPVERWPRAREIGSSFPGRDKSMTYKMKYFSLPSLVLGFKRSG